jgi:pyridoxine 5-phosphate synthase
MTNLGVNVDHVATLRQQRKEGFPDPVAAARVAVDAGANGITAHLREDRRHIQDDDIFRLKKELSVPLNLEMGVSEEILLIAETVKPAWACLVPERRAELTTEGGLDILTDPARIGRAIERLRIAGSRVSLFVEGRLDIMRQSKTLGANAVEIHTGAFARHCSVAGRTDGRESAEVAAALSLIGGAADEARRLGLAVHAGHGLDYRNTPALLDRFSFDELNIGFAIVSRAVWVGLGQAVREMKTTIGERRVCVES